MIFGLRLAKSDVDLTVGFAKGKAVAFSGWLCKGGMWRFAVGLASARLPGLQGCETMIPVRTFRNQCGLIGMLQWQIAAGGPSHFVGPFPFREPMPPSAICRCNLLCKLM